MSENLRKLFGHNIRRLRSERGLTQADLALKAGLNRSYLGNVERGQRNISLDNIAKVAHALAVSPEVLLKSEVET